MMKPKFSSPFRFFLLPFNSPGQTAVPGRILGSRSVLYKYLNPNVLLVVSSRKDPLESLTVRVMDGVTGNIYWESIYPGGSSQFSLHGVMCENWIVLGFWNQGSSQVLKYNQNLLESSNSEEDGFNLKGLGLVEKDFLDFQSPRIPLTTDRNLKIEKKKKKNGKKMGKEEGVPFVSRTGLIGNEAIGTEVIVLEMFESSMEDVQIQG